MRFAVGYQLPDVDDEPVVEIVREFRGQIDEVYFPWLDVPSGRSPMSGVHGISNDEARERLEADLNAFRAMGVKLNLLLNASCYGGRAFSRELAERVRKIVGRLAATVALDTVTTMSPMLACLVKRDFPDIDVRASVNMRLGTVRAFDYVRDLFDSFTMQREYNRDLARIAQLREWCDREGKTLHILANSGCLAWCAVQTFHDNLVSHEAEAVGHPPVSDNVPVFCWQYYRNRDHWVTFLQNTWVRPEDVHHYEGLFDVMKLATRMHASPRRVIRAYCATNASAATCPTSWSRDTDRSSPLTSGTTPASVTTGSTVSPTPPPPPRWTPGMPRSSTVCWSTWARRCTWTARRVTPSRPLRLPRRPSPDSGSGRTGRRSSTRTTPTCPCRACRGCGRHRGSSRSFASPVRWRPAW